MLRSCSIQESEDRELGSQDLKWLQGPHHLWCYLSHYTLLSNTHKVWEGTLTASTAATKTEKQLFRDALLRKNRNKGVQSPPRCVHSNVVSRPLSALTSRRSTSNPKGVSEKTRDVQEGGQSFVSNSLVVCSGVHLQGSATNTSSSVR